MIRLSPNDACLMIVRMRSSVSDPDKKSCRVLLIGWKYSALDLDFNAVTNRFRYQTKKHYSELVSRLACCGGNKKQSAGSFLLC